MMQKPLVSVIIPVYRRKQLIVRTLDSVCASSCHDLEILVMDDGSGDGTLEAVRKAALKDGRIHPVALEHKGVSAARNAGLDLSNGKYVFFLDSDDLIHPDLIRSEAGILDAGLADGVIARYIPFKEERTWNMQERLRMTCLSSDETRHCHNGHPLSSIGSIMISREHIGDLRFDEGLCSGEDSLFTYSLIRKTSRWAILQNQWYAYRRTPNSLSQRYSMEIMQSKMEAVQRIFQSEMADGKTQNVSDLLSWACHILNRGLLANVDNPEMKEFARS